MMNDHQAPILRDIGSLPFAFIGDGLRIIYACRVACISVMAGFWLLVTVPQARDLFLAANGAGIVGQASYPPFFENFFFWLWYFFAHVLAWSAMVHASAERLLSDSAWLIGPDRPLTGLDLTIYNRRFRRGVVALPYLLALSTFCAVAWGYQSALSDLPRPVVTSRETVDLLRGGTAGFYAALACGVVAHFGLWWRNIAQIRDAETGSLHVGRSASTPFSAWQTAVARHANTLLVIGIVLLFGLANLGAAIMEDWPGIYCVPILLGAWVPLLSLVGVESQRRRFPFTLLLVGLWLSAASGWGHSNRVNRAAVEPQPAMDFREAVASWKLANCIGEMCPRPILVTIAGGASRAAFFAATVLGELLDNPCTVPGRTCEAQGADRPLLAKRVFAISAVSGGSLAAIQAVAAISDAKMPANAPFIASPPCVDAKPDNYFKAPDLTKWRDCLQVLASRDFLMPTAIALITTEPFLFLERVFGWAICNGPCLDRAGILEQSWSTSYQNNVKGDKDELKGDLDQSFSGFVQKNVGQGRWIPLLVLNATAVENGKRVLSSHVDGRLDGKNIFVEALNAADFLGEPSANEPNWSIAKYNGLDLSLASAAMNSARFPIISPAGRFAEGGTVSLRVVDGGYFENDGATTATEIALALQNLGLSPVVIQIGNDPIDHIAGPDASERPVFEKESFLPFFAAPAKAVLATRQARGSYAVATLRGTVGSAGVASFRVFGETVEAGQAIEAEAAATAFDTMSAPRCYNIVGERRLPRKYVALKEVSMSWWLSQSVQQFLDRQTRRSSNCDAFFRVRQWLNEPPILVGQTVERPMQPPIKAPDH